jgi:hypothetical protein
MQQIQVQAREVRIQGPRLSRVLELVRDLSPTIIVHFYNYNILYQHLTWLLSVISHM